MSARLLRSASFAYGFDQVGISCYGGWGILNSGLIGIVAVIAAVALLVTGRYPERIFDVVLGINRGCCGSPGTPG